MEIVTIAYCTSRKGAPSPSSSRNLTLRLVPQVPLINGYIPFSVLLVSLAPYPRQFRETTHAHRILHTRRLLNYLCILFPFLSNFLPSEPSVLFQHPLPHNPRCNHN